MGLATVRDHQETYRAANARTNNKRPTTSQPLSPDPRPFQSLTEADLTTLWAGQRFPASALVTRQGVPVRVLHPGRVGRGAGPDFRDAILDAPSGGPLRGDVELHVRASDFVAHGHADDQRYDRVVLHVVFEDDGDGETRLACGRRAPVVALAPWARRRADELAAWLASPRLWREPCHDAIARLGREAVLLVLDDLGDARFRDRTVALAAAIERLAAAEALYRALLAGLGYGGNAALLEQLAERVPWRAVAPLLEASARDSPAVEQLLLAGAGPLLAAHAGRPANHPARRLAGLAALLVRHRPLFTEAPDVEALLALPPRDLVASFTAGALIGRSRAIELLVNAVLPWTAALAAKQGRLELAAAARARYEELPRPARYGALAFLEANLRDGDKPLALNARRQQGLLELYKAECTQGGCGRCRLS